MGFSHLHHNSRPPRGGFRVLSECLITVSFMLLPTYAQTNSEPVPGQFSEKFEELVTEARRAHEDAQKLEAALPTSMVGDKAAIERQISTRQLRLLETLAGTAFPWDPECDLPQKLPAHI